MSIISRLTTVAAAGAGGYAFSYWPVSISQSTAANTVTVTSYAADTGLIGSQVLSMPVRTVGAYTSYYFSADGNYFIFAEYESNTSSTTTSYIHVFDASGGPGTLSLLGTYSESGTYAINNCAISPNGTRIAYYRNNVESKVLDISSSISSPTVLATYTPSQFSFGPRSPWNFTPAGNCITGAGSDEGHSFVGTGLTHYTQSWNGWNQSSRGWNYNGTKHFYWGSAVNYNYDINGWYFSPTGTSGTSLGSGYAPTLSTSGSYTKTVNPNEAVDGLPYMVTRAWVDTGSQYQPTGNLSIRNYNTWAEVYTTGTVAGAQFFPDGKLQYYNTGTATYKFLDPTNSFSDVSSSYAPAFETLFPTYFWPVSGMQTLYTAI